MLGRILLHRLGQDGVLQRARHPRIDAVAEDVVEGAVAGVVLPEPLAP